MDERRPTLSGHLGELLPPPPATLHLEDWGEGLQIAPATGYRAPEEGRPAHVVVWNATGSQDPSDCLQRLDGHLDEDSSLVVAVALPAATGRKASKHQGRLPTRDQEQLRRVVLALSEGGFQVHRDREVISSDAGAWHLLRARRDAFRIRPYRAGDEEAILELFPRCFHVPRSREHWDWKYAGNPWGRHHLSVATSEGTLACHYAGYPVPFWWHDPKKGPKTFNALQMGDTMTNPDFREVGRGRSGLLARTVRHFFAIHRGGPLGFFYGFNTGPIQRFCNWFIGGTRVQPVGFWTLDLAEGPLSAFEHRSYLVDLAKTVDGSWNRLFSRVAPEIGFLVARDARWIEWRYLQCPDVDYTVIGAWHWGRLVGWSVFRRRDDRLVWGDALYLRRHRSAAVAVLRRALELPEFQGVTGVDAWFSSHPSEWLEQLAELGFASRPEPNDLALMALPEAEPEAAESLARLYYTMGDGDLF